VSKNKALRRIYEPKREKVTGGWRKLHNKELHKLYYSSYNIRMIILRRMRGVGHVECMRDEKCM
jgi:hypothetical protein